MVNGEVKRELRELKAFLLGNYKDTGHPRDAEVIALEMALDILVDGEGTQWAIDTIKSALRRWSWFRIVLGDHPDNPVFRRAIHLCESLSTQLLLVTGDARLASASLVGEWKFFEMPDDVYGDRLFVELDNYSRLRSKLPQYTMFVFNRLAVASGDGRIPAECQVAMNKLNSMIDLLPASNQLLSGRYKPHPFEWMYHTSYLKFSDKGNKFSRGKILAAVREVMEELRKCKTIFTNALENLESARNENEELYAAMLVNEAKWRSLAEKEVARFAAGVWRKREETGRLGGNPEGKKIIVKLVQCGDYTIKQVKQTVTREIDREHTIKHVVKEVYPPFPDACRWVVLRKPGAELGVLNSTDVDLWDSTNRGKRLWAKDWYDTIRTGDTVEIHVGVVKPVGPRSVVRDFEGGWSVEDEDEGRGIERAPGGPHASDARLVRGLLRRLRLAMPD